MVYWLLLFAMLYDAMRKKGWCCKSVQVPLQGICGRERMTSFPSKTALRC